MAEWRGCALLALLALLLAGAAPARAAAPAAGEGLSLAAALALLPETAQTRDAGVWYADYALAERIYGVSGIDSMTDPRLPRYFSAIVALRPGPETGVTQLYMGRWRQVYGYDLFQISTEMYSVTREAYAIGPAGRPPPGHLIAADVGPMDTRYIAHVLATAGYTARLHGGERIYTRAPAPASALPDAALNAVSLGANRLVCGSWTSDVVATALSLRHDRGTLGQDSGYRGLAAALGPVQGAYLAANVPPPPFAYPPGGHRGPRLHAFGLYAVAYQEPRPGLRYMLIALAYPRRADALADVPVLRARFRAESLPVYSATWRSLIRLAGISVHGTVLLARLRLAPATPATLWQDAITEGDLTILSR